METASPLPLQNCTTATSITTNNNITNHHNPNNPIQIQPNEQFNSPSILAGNEENAPENTLQQKQQPQRVVLKKMRIGGSPFPQHRRLSSNHNSRHLNNHDDDVPPPPHSFRVTHDGKNVDAGGFLVSSPVDVLQVVPSASDTNSASSSIHSHNWLDDFGKQNKGNAKNTNNTSSKPTMMRAPDKDPRFHCKRKTQPDNHNHKAVVSENAPPPTSSEAPFFTQKDLEEAPVFLAPVLLRHSPTARMEQQVESPWKESTNGFASPPPSSVLRRSTVHSSSNKPLSFTEAFRPDAMDPSGVVAWESQEDATQEAPGLTTSLSQETATSSTAMSALTASSTTSSMASTLVKRMVLGDNKPLSIAQKDAAKGRLCRQGIRGTPIRMKPRVRTQEVQATDSGYASVAKLSAWLADDPTSTKKVKHVRRGRNVISKSRKFEKDLEGVIVEENNIATGAVKEKKNWLKSAFAHEEEGDDSSRHMDDSFSSHHHDHSDRHMMMMMRTQPVNLDDDCARSDFVVSNDAASSISVSHKKKWLQSAFKKEGDTGQRRMSYARSDIGPAREHRDDVTSRAKQMWQQKSEKRLGDGPSSATKFHAAAPSPYRKQRPPAPRDTTPGKSLEERMRARMGATRASAPSHMLGKAVHAANPSAKPTTRHSVAVVQVEEDKTPVDFRAARELLIQRSKQNGNEVKLVSKVQTRANKFEKISKDTKRRASSTGLLKPTWDCNSSVAGSVASDAPSDAYIKSFVEDVAPQKSFDELP